MCDKFIIIIHQPLLPFSFSFLKSTMITCCDALVVVFFSAIVALFLSHLLFHLIDTNTLVLTLFAELWGRC